MVAFTTQNTRFEGSSGSRLRGVSAVAELTVSLASGSPRPTADRPRRQRPVSVYSRPARRLGDPNPHLPSGAFSSHRMAVAFVCVGWGLGSPPPTTRALGDDDCVLATHTRKARPKSQQSVGIRFCETCFLSQVRDFGAPKGAPGALLYRECGGPRIALGRHFGAFFQGGMRKTAFLETRKVQKLFAPVVWCLCEIKVILDRYRPQK